MRNLASVISHIQEIATTEKLAADRLFESDSTPTISTDIGLALAHTAQLLKTAAAADITNEDLSNFMETLKNA